MDDAALWESMTYRGEPVAHCRDKLKNDRKQRLAELARRCERSRR
jgi:hypothetical protein